MANIKRLNLVVGQKVGRDEVQTLYAGQDADEAGRVYRSALGDASWNVVGHLKRPPGRFKSPARIAASIAEAQEEKAANVAKKTAKKRAKKDS